MADTNFTNFHELKVKVQMRNGLGEDRPPALRSFIVKQRGFAASPLPLGQEWHPNSFGPGFHAVPHGVRGRSLAIGLPQPRRKTVTKLTMILRFISSLSPIHVTEALVEGEHADDDDDDF